MTADKLLRPAVPIADKGYGPDTARRGAAREDVGSRDVARRNRKLRGFVDVTIRIPRDSMERRFNKPTDRRRLAT